MRRFFEFAGKGGTLLATLALVVVTLFLVFPNLPINGELLDQKTSYSYSEAIDALEGYGAEGRTMYLWISLVLDTLFPFIYVTFFAGLIYRFRAFEGTWWLAYIPILGGIWDLMEHAQISLMLIGYPEVSEAQVAWASVFTQAKHWIGSVYLAIGFLLALVSITRTTFTKIRSSDTGE